MGKRTIIAISSNSLHYVIQVLATAESNFAVLDGYHVTFHANLWQRKRSSLAIREESTDTLDVGKTYVFVSDLLDVVALSLKQLGQPFEFEALPRDVKVGRPDSTVREFVAVLSLPS